MKTAFKSAGMIVSIVATIANYCLFFITLKSLFGAIGSMSTGETFALLGGLILLVILLEGVIVYGFWQFEAYMEEQDNE